MHMKSTGTVLAHSRVPARHSTPHCFACMLTRCPYRRLCMAVRGGSACAVRGVVCRVGPTLAKVQPSVLRECDEHGDQHLQHDDAQRRAGLVDRPLVEQRHPYGAHAPRRCGRERLATRADDGDGTAQHDRDEAHALLALLGHRQQLSEPAEHAKLPAAVAHPELVAAQCRCRAQAEVREVQVS